MKNKEMRKMKRRARMLAASVVTSLLFCSACGETKGDVKGDIKTDVSQNTEEVPEADSKSEITKAALKTKDYPVTGEITGDLAAGINRLGLNIFAGLEAKENQFFSPYSISGALSILDIGAGGTTKEEMEEVLGIDDLSSWSMQMEAFLSKEWSEDTYLLTANSLWANPGSEWAENVETDFFAPALFYYNCEVFEADFKNNLDTVSKQITAWVNKNTDGMIPDYKTASDKNTAMSIINAVFFEGKWEYPFKGKDTQADGSFRNAKGDWERDVPMMKQWNITLGYFENDSFQGVELPYKDSTLVMDILLPKTDNIMDYHNLSLEEQEALWGQFDMVQPKKLDTLMMPAFTMDLSIQGLPEILKDLGMEKAFEPDADLDKIGPERYVTDIAHRAKIEVCEEGTRAAAITEIVTNDACALEPIEVLEFIANSPFVYVIRDTKTGIILFLGQVTTLK